VRRSRPCSWSLSTEKQAWSAELWRRIAGRAQASCPRWWPRRGVYSGAEVLARAPVGGVARPPRFSGRRGARAWPVQAWRRRPARPVHDEPSSASGGGWSRTSAGCCPLIERAPVTGPLGPRRPSRCRSLPSPARPGREAGMGARGRPPRALGYQAARADRPSAAAAGLGSASDERGRVRGGGRNCCAVPGARGATCRGWSP